MKERSSTPNDASVPVTAPRLNRALNAHHAAFVAEIHPAVQSLFLHLILCRVCVRPSVRLAFFIIPRSHAMHVRTLRLSGRLCEFGLLPSEVWEVVSRKTWSPPLPRGGKEGQGREGGKGEGRKKLDDFEGTKRDRGNEMERSPRSLCLRVAFPFVRRLVSMFFSVSTLESFSPPVFLHLFPARPRAEMASGTSKSISPSPPPQP